MNLYTTLKEALILAVLVLCWILMNLYVGSVQALHEKCFSTLLDIDELILERFTTSAVIGFSTLLDIDELIQKSCLQVKMKF